MRGHVLVNLALLSTLLSSCCAAPVNDTNLEENSVNATATNDTSVGGPWDPDYVDCDPIYGDSLNVDSCQKAANKIYADLRLPRPISLSKTKSTGAFRLRVPQTWRDDDNHPTCQITIDLAGPPADVGQGRTIFSNLIKSEAEKVIKQCVKPSTWAGYATYGMEKSGLAMEELKGTTFSAPPFITITVAPPNVQYRSPGDTDPRIPLALAYPLDRFRSQALYQKTIDKTTVIINQLEYQSSLMYPGGSQAWWDTEPFQEIVPGGVDYQCDEKFGAPGTLQLQQCKRASWNFIHRGPAPDIRHGTPLVFKSGQCLFKVEATDGTVQIDWEAMRAAVDTLLYTCLERPEEPFQTGGQVVYRGGPGSSKDYPWPDNILITMGDAGVVNQVANVTTTQGIEEIGRGNVSYSHSVLDGVSASPISTS